MENEKRLIDKEKVYQRACAGCTRHGETPGECYHDEPCERLIFAFTTAEPVDAVEVVRCKDCISGQVQPYSRFIRCNVMGCAGLKPDDFCSYGERKDK